MLQHAQAKGLTTVHADATHLPFDAADLDAVMPVSMLHHIDDPPHALETGRPHSVW